MKILLGIPTYDGHLRVELAPFLAEFEPHEIFPIMHRPIDVARNLAVNEAQYQKADILFMVDADAAPLPGTRQALLDVVAKEECVCGCPYYTSARQMPVTLHHQTEPIQALKGVQQVENIGTHLIAYRTSVFDKITPPYFYHTYNERHTAQTNTEDYVLNERLYKAGVKLYAHYDYWCGHTKEKCITK